MTATAGAPEALANRGATRLPRAYYVAAAVAPLLILAVWGALLLARPGVPMVVRVGDPAPAFSLADLDGNPITVTY